MTSLMGSEENGNLPKNRIQSVLGKLLMSFKERASPGFTIP